MSKSKLSDYFKGVAIKRLSEVEANPYISHQHEFNGISGLKKILGEDRKKFPTTFIYFSDDEDDTAVSSGYTTWYNARERHKTRSEHRFYFTSSSVMEKAVAGDLLLVAIRPEHEILVIVAQADSTPENQLGWLFGINKETDEISEKTIFRSIVDKDTQIDLLERTILEALDIDIPIEENSDLLETLLKEFPCNLPTTRDFSRFTRQSIKDISAIDDPDLAIKEWMSHEETLFKMYEKHEIEKQMALGFDDVDKFTSFAISVVNRRKSRAGKAFENHLEEIFKINELSFNRNPITENKSRPDFIFPGIKEYYDNRYADEKLAMLAVKTTCKDRWRQILAEAEKIKSKHLATLEPGISINQTNEMKHHNVFLVIPRYIHGTYKHPQQKEILDIGGFISFVKEISS